MKKSFLFLLIGSILLNVIFIVLLINDKADERNEKEYLISKFVENQKKISYNFNQLYIDLANVNGKKITSESDMYRLLLDTLIETDRLLQFNEELYLDNIDKQILSPSMRAINMEGLGIMPMLWNKFHKGDIKEELPSIMKYNSLLKIFLDKLNNEHNFQNVHNPKQMTKILNDVSTELLN